MLVAGATGMGSAVVGQEAGSAMFPTNSTSNSTGSQFGHGLVPTAYINGVFGGVVGTALAKSLCDLGVPGFKELLEDLDALQLARSSSTLGQGLSQLLQGVFADIGIETARAATFASHLQRALQFVHLQGPADAIEFLTRGLLRDTSQLISAVAEGTVSLASPAVDALVGFGAMSGTAMGLPLVPLSPVGPAPAISNLGSISGQLSNIAAHFSHLPTAAGLATEAQAAADTLRAGLSQAAADIIRNPSRPNLSDSARYAIKKTSKFASGKLDILGLLHPAHSHCEGKEHTSVAATTRTVMHTSTSTVYATRISQYTTTVSASATITATCAGETITCTQDASTVIIISTPELSGCSVSAPQLNFHYGCSMNTSKVSRPV
jgi:hypothetical protein